jgi:hypothetical protein
VLHNATLERLCSGKHFIFIETYECAQYARVLDNTKLERLISDKYFGLSSRIISYEENEVL